MNHLTDNELINYIGGLLSDEWNKQVEAHLKKCPECHANASFLQEIHEEWNDPTVATSPQLENQIMDMIAIKPVQTFVKQDSQHRKVSIPKRNKNIKYFHFALAAAVMIFISQIGVIDFLQTKPGDFVGSTSKKMNDATLLFTKKMKDLNKLPEKQNKMEDGKNEKTK